MGNTTDHIRRCSSWKSIRIGTTPLLTNGQPYTGGWLLPWFIQRSEVEAAIEREKQKTEWPSQLGIEVFQQMLDTGKVNI